MMLASLTRYWFLLGLGVVGALAFLVPDLGARGGPLRPEITTRAAVAVIFFIQGVVITPQALQAGALRWRLHAAVQVFVFVLFPLGAILLDVAAGGVLPPDLRLGFLFLAVLPTTISSCVVFTAAARGNAAGALFNSVLANLIGVVLTPLWAAFLLRARGEAPPLGPMVIEVVLLLLVPLAVGQIARPLIRRVWEPKPVLLAVLSSLIILYIIFAAFANSVATGAFRQTGVDSTLVVALAAVGIFALATWSAAAIGRRLGFDAGDRRALIFCAPQKTLAAGAPMAQILFAGHASVGLILLPVIIYHAVQLLGAASLVERFRGADSRGVPPN